MSLFQESIIRKHLGYLDQDLVDQAYLRFKKVYSANKISNIKIANEEQYQEGFIKDIFGEVLGYSVFPDQPFNIQTEKKNEANSKKADGAIFQGENVVGVIELKDNKTKNLDAVKDQAFGYKNNHKECSYVISSNFHKLRFYVDDATDYEEFDLYNLDKDSFKRFYLYLHKDGLLDKNIPKLLRNETKFHEENITKSLYKDYSSFKNSFFQNVVKNNPQYDKLLLFKKSQKFLDKVLFVLFAEDKGLVSTNSIVQIVEKWNSLKNDAFDTPKPLYQLIALFFNNLFIGKKDQKGGVLIPEFGGEIFAPDEVLDTLMVDDEVLQDDLLKLSKYDFNTDIDVNILGHIFEHSLSEIEEVEASLKGEVADKTKGKRKKDGVFYTPKYITKYIVENTIGTLCAEKKKELELDRDIAIFEYQKADGKLNAKGIELYTTLNKYKDWLLTLKILDPACGSGAFLNQAVNFLVQEHAFIDDIIAELTNSPLRLYDTDIAILENNIYGVDINEESIEIAKLSLWLRTARKGRKLSNLSNNIKCGNSLIDDPEVAGDKAFNWHNEFPEVFANGGFDVVIGNPPYGAKFTTEEKEFYNNKYRFQSYQIDSYLIFTEKLKELLTEGGYASYIMPNTWLSTLFSDKIRDFVFNEFTLVEISHYSYFVFEEATVETDTYIFKNIKPQNNQINIFFYDKNGDTSSKKISQNELIYLKGKPFNIKENDDFKIIKQKVFRYQPLGDKFQVVQGTKPFQKGKGKPLQDENTINCQPFVKETKVNELFQPLLRGSLINRYINYWNNDYWILFGDNLAEPRYSAKYDLEKLVVRQTGDSIIATYDNNKFIARDNLYVIRDDNNCLNLKILMTLLNSKLITWIFRKFINPEEGKAMAQVKRGHLIGLPIPEVPISLNCNYLNKAELMLLSSKELQEQTQKFKRSLERKFALTELPKKLQDWYLLSYADFIKELGKKKIKLSLSEEAEWEMYFTSEAKKALELKAQIDKTDKEIDQMVYALYELTEDEIKIVEAS